MKEIYWVVNSTRPVGEGIFPFGYKNKIFIQKIFLFWAKIVW